MSGICKLKYLGGDKYAVVYKGQDLFIGTFVEGLKFFRAYLNEVQS